MFTLQKQWKRVMLHMIDTGSWLAVQAARWAELRRFNTRDRGLILFTRASETVLPQRLLLKDL